VPAGLRAQTALRLARPTPCSALIEPPQPIDRVVEVAPARAIEFLGARFPATGSSHADCRRRDAEGQHRDLVPPRDDPAPPAAGDGAQQVRDSEIGTVKSLRMMCRAWRPRSALPACASRAATMIACSAVAASCDQADAAPRQRVPPDLTAQHPIRTRCARHES